MSRRGSRTTAGIKNKKEKEKEKKAHGSRMQESRQNQ
jgi:hypothetical protein